MNRKTREAFLIFLAHFVVLAVGYFVLPASVTEHRVNDYENRFEPVARSLLAGKGYCQYEGVTMTHYPPGNAFFLVAVFWLAQQTGLPEQPLLILIAVGLQAISGALLFRLAREFWAALSCVLVSFVTLAYFPNTLLTFWGSSEAIYSPFLILSLLLFWRGMQNESRWRFFLVGLLFGIGMLIRPFVTYLPVFFVALMISNYSPFKFSKRMVLAGCMLAGVALAILPWQIWTYQQTKQFYLVSSIGPDNVVIGIAYALPRPVQLDIEVPPGVRSLMHSIIDYRSQGKIESFSGLFSWLRNEALTHPGDFANLLARKVTRVWFATDSHRHEMTLFYLQLPLLSIGLMGVFLCLRSTGDLRRFAMLCIVVIAFYWLMATAGASILRYMAPVMPLVLLMSTPVLERALGRMGILKREEAKLGSHS